MSNAFREKQTVTNTSFKYECTIHPQKHVRLGFHKRNFHTIDQKMFSIHYPIQDISIDLKTLFITGYVHLESVVCNSKVLHRLFAVLFVELVFSLYNYER